jgi:hypothetical protein
MRGIELAEIVSRVVTALPRFKPCKTRQGCRSVTSFGMTIIEGAVL